MASRSERTGWHQPAPADGRDADAADAAGAGGRAAAARAGAAGKVSLGAGGAPAACGDDGPGQRRSSMRLALSLNYSGAAMSLDIARIAEAERLGYDSVWTAEAYGSDAVVPAAWIAARTERIHIGTGIMQIPARTPAMTAMTAMTLDALSGGRFRLGLGVSGPQVAEGWHGQPFGKPLVKTREYIEIVRTVLRREKSVEFRGEYYQIPYTGPGATGLGKPLRSILHGRADLPIYVAAVGPKNVALAAELADGWIPVFFSARRPRLFQEWLSEGFKAAG